MARWAPDAAGRLRAAALVLYAERGYEETTVAEIAEAAGLTERTFYRHFADKREVLFHGSEGLRDQIVDAVAAAPRGAPALDAVVAGLASLASFFADRAWSRERSAVIASSPDLRERELIKRAMLVDAVAAALRERGESPATATLAAESGVTIFHVAYERWVRDAARRPYDAHVTETVAELRAVSGVAPAAAAAQAAAAPAAAAPAAAVAQPAAAVAQPAAAVAQPAAAPAAAQPGTAPAAAVAQPAAAEESSPV